MADKPTATTELERIYTIPLRKTKDLVRSRRADLAVRDVKRFLTRHMKSENIWLDQEVNQHLWARGKYTIPSRIRVRATRFSDGVVEVTLPETSTTGSVRSEIQTRREKAAENPVLKAPAPAEGDEDEGGHDHDAEETKRPVTDVKGVGPATAEKLVAAGIKDLGALAHASAKDVAEAAGVAEDKAAAWVSDAHDILAGKHEVADVKAQPALKADKAAKDE